MLSQKKANEATGFFARITLVLRGKICFGMTSNHFQSNKAALFFGLNAHSALCCLCLEQVKSVRKTNGANFFKFFLFPKARILYHQYENATPIFTVYQTKPTLATQTLQKLFSSFPCFLSSISTQSLHWVMF